MICSGLVWCSCTVRWVVLALAGHSAEGLFTATTHGLYIHYTEEGRAIACLKRNGLESKLNYQDLLAHPMASLCQFCILLCAVNVYRGEFYSGVVT